MTKKRSGVTRQKRFGIRIVVDVERYSVATLILERLWDMRVVTDLVMSSGRAAFTVLPPKHVVDMRAWANTFSERINSFGNEMTATALEL